MKKAILAGALLLLVACGGDSPMSGGGGPPPQTAYDERSARILALNPMVLSSDTLEVPPLRSLGSPPERLGLSVCRAGRCTHPLVEGSFPIADMLDSEGYGEPVAYRGVDNILLGGVHEVDPETDEHYGIELLGLGGWLDESAFFVGAIARGEYLGATRFLGSYSIGRPSRTNPTMGSATWNGVMLGVETAPSAGVGARYDGNATVTVDLDDTTTDVKFNNISNSETYAPYPDMAWNDIPLAGGTFRNDTRRTGGTILVPRLEGSLIEGRFYGRTHAEVGGIFETPDMLGAFGAKRQ